MDLAVKLPKTICGLLVFSFLIRLIFIIKFPITFFSDDAIYASLARFWINGDFQHVFHPTWPPFFPLISAFFYLIFHQWELSLRVVSALAGTMLLIPLFFLARKLLPFWHTLVYVLIISISVPFFSSSVVALSDSLAAFLTISGITLFYFALNQNRVKYYLLSAVLFGLSYLTRSEGGMFFTLSTIYLFLTFVYKTFKKKRIDDWKLIVAFVVVFFVIISPYLYITSKQLGYFSLSAKTSAQIQQGRIFAIRKNTTWAQEIASIKSPNYHSQYFRGWLSYIDQHLSFLEFQFNQRLSAWIKFILRYFPVWSIPILLLGIYYTLNKKFLLNFYLLFILAPSIFAAIFATDYPEDRYYLWAFPIILYFIFTGFHYLFYYLLRIKRYYNLSLIFITLLFITASTFIIKDPAVFGQEFSKNNYTPEIKETGEWIKDHSPNPDPKIMARHEGFEFYSDGETIYLPQTSYQKLIDYAKYSKVDYLVAWEAEISLDPGINTLLNPGQPHPNLKKVYQTKSQKGIIVVYRLDH